MAKPKRKKQRQKAKRATLQAVSYIAPERVFRPSVSRTPETYIEPTLQERTTSVTYARVTRIHGLDEDGNSFSFLLETGERTELLVEPYRSSDEPTVEDPDINLSRMEGEWTADIVRACIKKAFEVELRSPGRNVAPSEGRAFGGLEVVRDASEAYGYGEVQVREPVTVAEIALRDFVFPDWMLMLETPQARRAVICAAQGLPLRKIGSLTGCSHEQARKTIQAAYDRIATTLNSVARAA